MESLKEAAVPREERFLLRGSGDAVYEEKRSRFLGRCAAAATEAEARAVIEAARAAHKTAGHHVYAYAVEENGMAYTRCSDDGEPQGTAGLPVLNVFLHHRIVRFVCVVTRYFGGTLLGTGGLTRAYGRTAKAALQAAGFEPLIEWRVYELTVAYPKHDSFQYALDKLGLAADVVYGADCRATVRVPEPQEEEFLRSMGLFVSQPPRRL